MALLPPPTVSCDPAPENAIIIVCAVYVTPNQTLAERIFPGALCWYTDAPTSRKRARREQDDEEPTFVTTIYNSRLKFAGICIGQPREQDRAGTIRIGVAISGAVTIARRKPPTDDVPLQTPLPGFGAFFDPSGGIIFEPGETRDAPLDEQREDSATSPDLLRDIVLFLRSVLPTNQLFDSDAATIITTLFMAQNHLLRWLTLEQIQTELQQLGFNEEQTEALSRACFSLNPYQSGTPITDFGDQLPAVAHVCRNALLLQNKYNDIPIESILQILQRLKNQQLDVPAGSTTVVRQWARVLDTGSGETVRLLLRLA